MRLQSQQRGACGQVWGRRGRMDALEATNTHLCRACSRDLPVVGRHFRFGFVVASVNDSRLLSTQECSRLWARIPTICGVARAMIARDHMRTQGGDQRDRPAMLARAHCEVQHRLQWQHKSHVWLTLCALQYTHLAMSSTFPHTGRWGLGWEVGAWLTWGACTPFGLVVLPAP